MAESTAHVVARRQGLVCNHGKDAGVLEELPNGRFRFTYAATFLANASARPVSLTLPLRLEPYESDGLFAFFSGLLAEGPMRQLQARVHRIDVSDEFGLLLVAGREAIGSVTVEAFE